MTNIPVCHFLLKFVQFHHLLLCIITIFSLCCGCRYPELLEKLQFTEHLCQLWRHGFHQLIRHFTGRVLHASQNPLHSHVYGALPPSGTLSTRMRHMRRDMVNMDSCKINEMISDIRNADLCHQQEAARIIDEILGRSAIVTVGNEKCIMKDKDVFDQVLIYHTDYA